MSEQAVVDYWSSVKEIVDRLCKSHDALWQKRSRVLNTKIIVIMIFKIILSDRRQGLAINLAEFWDNCAGKDIKLPQNKSVTASSFCEARQKVPENIFKDLNKELLKNWNQKRSLPLWLGHRVYATDGSKVNIPRELIKFGFKTYDERRHYPQALLSCLYDVLSKTVYDFDFVSHLNERTCALEHLEILEPNDVVIFDRGYFSYLLLHEFDKKGVHVIFRLQQEGSTGKQIEAFIKSSKTEEIINYVPSTKVICGLKKQGYFLKPIPIPFRLIKHSIKGESYLYGTTLMGEKYPANCFLDLYHERWSIEELYKISKRIVDIEEFHSKTERGVKQEIYAHVLLINLSRFFEFDAHSSLPPMNQEDREKCSEVNFYKFFNPTSMFNINFKNCLMAVGRYIENLFLGTYEGINNWTTKMIHMILRVRQKIRPGRSFPRRSFKIESGWSKRGQRTRGAH